MSAVKFIPNSLSFLRIIISITLIPLVKKGDFSSVLLLFLAASASDFLDGYLARKLKVTSNFGAALDPLADKFLMIISYILFACEKLIPTYVTVLVVGRDVLILFVVVLCRISDINLKMQPLMSSKINTTLQLIFILLVTTCNLFPINVPFLGEACAIVVSASTIFSGVEYVQKYYWIRDRFFKR